MSPARTGYAGEGSRLNPANIATGIRILLIPFFIYCLSRGDNVPALGLFALAMLTDFLDGYFARTYKFRTKLGSYLDPAADKLLVASSLITLTILGSIPIWLTVLVFARDLVISIGTGVVALVRGAMEIRPTFSGKAGVFFQLVLVFVVLLARQPASGVVGRLARSNGAREVIDQLVYVTAFFTIVSGFQYLYRGGREILGKGA